MTHGNLQFLSLAHAPRPPLNALFSPRTGRTSRRSRDHFRIHTQPSSSGCQHRISTFGLQLVDRVNPGPRVPNSRRFSAQPQREELRIGEVHLVRKTETTTGEHNVQDATCTQRIGCARRRRPSARGERAKRNGCHPPVRTPRGILGCDQIQALSRAKWGECRIAAFRRHGGRRVRGCGAAGRAWPRMAEIGKPILGLPPLFVLVLDPIWPTAPFGRREMRVPR